MNCSLVIRAYNEEKHLGRLMEGIAQQTIQDIQVILVDSGSTDATVSIAEDYGALVVHILPKEFTFGRSLNLGLAEASRELVVIVSAHVFPVYPDWIEHLLGPFSDPQVALTYGKQRGDARSKFSEQQVYLHWYPDQSNSRQEQPFCNNANAAIRRSLWEKNPYDETLTGLEDLAWAKAAVEAGYVLAYSAEAEIIHLHSETPKGVANRYRREAMAFKRLYPEAHFSLYDFFRMSSANILSDLGNALHQHRFLKNCSNILWYRLMQFWGTWQGYRRSMEWNWQLRQTFYYPHRTERGEKPASREVEPIRYNSQ